jgi:hypothetical protein
MMLPLSPQSLTLLFQLEQKDGKWSGKFLGASERRLGAGKIEDVTVTADTLKLALKFPGLDFSVEGRLPADAKTNRISGSVQLNGQLVPIQLAATKLEVFDLYELNKEQLASATEPAEMAELAIELIREGSSHKAKIEEVRGWADKAFRSAGAHGPRWQRAVAVRLLQGLGEQAPYGPLAVEYARKTERLLDPSDEASVQMEVLQAVSFALQKGGKPDDAKEIQAQLAKLEERDFAEYLKRRPFRPDVFEGRKSKSNRVVLVEVFTGAEHSASAAAIHALDALEMTYRPVEVALLNYHIHAQQPDPLTNADTMDRISFYKKQLESLPAAIFNGKVGGESGGPVSVARQKYAQFRDAIEPLLEQDAKAKLDLTAERKGNSVAIKATFADLAKTGEGIRLRLALTESQVRYPGGNGVRYHQHVVRMMPGGTKGYPLTKKAGDQSVTVNLDELRAKLVEYLDDFNANEAKFTRADRPLNLKILRVVAMVQDDATGEIFQAAQVEVK